MYRFLTSKLLWETLLALAALALIGRAVLRRKRVRRGEENYKPYKALLLEAFKNDKSSRDRVMEAIAYLDDDKPAEAEKLLQRLMVECHDPDDATAVRVMLAICYQRLGEDLKAERYYRRVLEDARKKRPVHQIISDLNAGRRGRMDLVEKAVQGIVFEEEEAEEEE